MNEARGLEGRIVALIPARAGSKGIPKKNIFPLAGRPLIAYTIEAARACPWIDRVLVLTDDDEIAEVARAWGAEVPYRRSAANGTDRASLQDVGMEAFRWLTEVEHYPLAAVVWMYPSNPFRTWSLMRDCVEPVAAGRASGADVVIRWEFDPEDLVALAADGTVVMPLSEHTVAYQTVGSVTVSRTGFCVLPRRLVVLDDPALWHEIDTFEDVRKAEKIIVSGRWSWEMLHAPAGVSVA